MIIACASERTDEIQSAATLKDVVTAYNSRRFLGLSDAQMNDLAEYLKSL